MAFFTEERGGDDTEDYSDCCGLITTTKEANLPESRAKRGRTRRTFRAFHRPENHERALDLRNREVRIDGLPGG